MRRGYLITSVNPVGSLFGFIDYLALIGVEYISWFTVILFSIQHITVGEYILTRVDCKEARHYSLEYFNSYCTVPITVAAISVHSLSGWSGYRDPSTIACSKVAKF